MGGPFSPRRRPRIAVAGLAIESSTFSPARTDAAAFHPRRGDEVLAKYAFLHAGQPLRESADWHGALIGHALPGGIVTREAFEALAGEIVARLEDIVSGRGAATSTTTSATASTTASGQPESSTSDGAPSSPTGLDGLWFDIHGAMTVEGLDDAEAELLSRVRAVVGPRCIVSASMDLHGNVSRALAHGVDLVTCYRLAPHEDALETKERACRNLVDALLGKEEERSEPKQRTSDAVTEQKPPLRRPLKAWVPVPILLPGEQTSTRDEPAKSLYQSVGTVASRPGILDAAVWVGYAWADEARNRAAVVVTGWEAEAVERGAEELARQFWSSRAGFHFVAPTGTFAECLDAAVAAPPEKKPFFVSDSGDNPTAGGAGDVTWALARLLERPEFQDRDEGSSDGKKKKVLTAIYASIPGAEAAETAAAAGVGATVTVCAGAAVDDTHGGPVQLTGVVTAVKRGDPHAGTEAVVAVGGVSVIVTGRRKPYHLERDFTELGLAPREADVVVVKIGYLEPQLYDMAAGWMLALTPGGVDQDLKRLGHARIRRPMWPFDEKFDDEPDLRARFVPMSNEQLTGEDE